MEFLEDTEKRILLSAISREKKVCEQVDNESCREPHETSLTDICKSLEYKFMYDRLFKKIYEQGRADYAKEISANFDDMDRTAYRMGRADGIVQGRADAIDKMVLKIETDMPSELDEKERYGYTVALSILLEQLKEQKE